ncbi:hypothetical protein GCM10017691_57280 [Pseudonocardia petroleophila]
MRPHLPWLCQGDIFRDVPVVDVALQGRGTVRPRVSNGPAILLTHGCVLDKRTNSGKSRVERLQFAPLKAMTLLNADKARNLVLKARELAPSEVMYLGEIGEFGAAFFSFTDPYWLPAQYFELTFQLFPEHLEADETGEFVCPTINDTRMGRIESDELILLSAKLVAFWTRQKAGPPAT